MKYYLLYLLPRKKLYAFTNNKDELNLFLSQRNSSLFIVRAQKIRDDDDANINFLIKNKLLQLIKIPLESSDGDCYIIGTQREENVLNGVCERLADTFAAFKFHFTENFLFNDEYTELLDNLTTISKNINNHPIMQIDSVKLFYSLFKETFIDSGSLDLLTDEDTESTDIISLFKSQF